MFTSAIHAASPHNAVMNIRLFLGGRSPPKPSQGPGPGCAGLRPASAEVWGNPGSPSPSPRAYVHVSRPCDSRTTPDEHRLGARAGRPRRVSAGTVTAPLPSPPPAGGRESGSSPRRGEAGRRAEGRERWSPQPHDQPGIPDELLKDHQARPFGREVWRSQAPPRPSPRSGVEANCQSSLNHA